MPQKVSSRPQTLRQARRAFQKSGGAVRLTERERRQLERSAELQERAARIRERENKRKANLRKKHERIEREREARQRMGISSPIKETVGASQMRLSKFLEIGTGLKRKWGESPVLTSQSSSEECRASQSGHAVEKAIQGRHPLELLSHNQVMASPAQISTHTPENHNGALSAPTKPRATIGTDGCSQRSPSKYPNLSTVLPQPKPASSRQTKDSTKPASTTISNISPKTATPIQANAREIIVKAPQTSAPEPNRSAMLAGSMRPPPKPTISAAAAAKPSKINDQSLTETNSKSTAPSQLPPSPKPLLPPSNSSHTHQPSQSRPSSNNLASCTNLPKAQPKESSDDSWTAFLVSNTQIERELSTPDTVLKAAPATPKVPTQPPAYRKHGFPSARQPMGPPLPPPLKPPKDETAALVLAGICTQDLNYGGDFSSSDGPEEEEEEEEEDIASLPEVRTPTATLSFGDDELSDSELEDVARGVEQASSSSSSSSSSPGPTKDQQKAKETFCEDDFDLSTQELCELVD